MFTIFILVIALFSIIFTVALFTFVPYRLIKDRSLRREARSLLAQSNPDSLSIKRVIEDLTQAKDKESKDLVGQLTLLHENPQQYAINPDITTKRLS